AQPIVGIDFTAIRALVHGHAAKLRRLGTVEICADGVLGLAVGQRAPCREGVRMTEEDSCSDEQGCNDEGNTQCSCVHTSVLRGGQNPVTSCSASSLSIVAKGE